MAELKSVSKLSEAVAHAPRSRAEVMGGATAMRRRAARAAPVAAKPIGESLVCRSSIESADRNLALADWQVNRCVSSRRISDSGRRELRTFAEPQKGGLPCAAACSELLAQLRVAISSHELSDDIGVGARVSSGSSLHRRSTISNYTRRESCHLVVRRSGVTPLIRRLARPFSRVAGRRAHGEDSVYREWR